MTGGGPGGEAGTARRKGREEMRIDRRGFMFGAAALAGSQCLAAGRTLAHKPKEDKGQNILIH